MSVNWAVNFSLWTHQQFHNDWYLAYAFLIFIIHILRYLAFYSYIINNARDLDSSGATVTTVRAGLSKKLGLTPRRVAGWTFSPSLCPDALRHTKPPTQYVPEVLFVRQPRCLANHSPPSTARLKASLELYPNTHAILWTCLHRASHYSTSLLHRQVHFKLLYNVISLFHRQVSAHLHHLQRVSSQLYNSIAV